MTRLSFSLAAIAAILCGCATAPARLWQAPPDTDTELAAFDATPPCHGGEYAIYPAHVPEHPHLPYARYCIPPFPASLMRAGIEGDCTVKFDVDETGTPYNIDPVCTAFTSDPEWKPLAEELFRQSTQRAMSESRFAVPADSAEKPSTGLVQPVKFMFAD